MYLPSRFREERIEALREGMRTIAFASLVAHGPKG